MADTAVLVVLFLHKFFKYEAKKWRAYVLPMHRLKRTTPMFKKNIRTLLTAAAFTTVISTPTFASAKSFSDEGRLVSAKFSASLTQTPQGLRKVYRQLQKQASFACKGESSSRLSSYRSSKECADDIMSQFIQDADLAALTQLHTGPKIKVATKK